MKLEYLVAIGVRLFAIGLAVNVLRSLSLVPTYLNDSTSHSELIVFYVTTAAFALLALMLWVFPLIVARKIGAFPPQDPDALKDDAYHRLLEVGLILVGIYLLYFAIADAAYWIYLIRHSADMVEAYGEYPGLTPANTASIVYTAVEFVLAIFLILGHRGVARLVWKVRTA